MTVQRKVPIKLKNFNRKIPEAKSEHFSENTKTAKNFSKDLVLSIQFQNVLKKGKWHHRKLDYFRLILRVSSLLSNNNLAPADNGNHQFHAPFTWYPVPLLQQSLVKLVNTGHGWFPVSNSSAELVPQV